MSRYIATLGILLVPSTVQAQEARATISSVGLTGFAIPDAPAFSLNQTVDSQLSFWLPEHQSGRPESSEEAAHEEMAGSFLAHPLPDITPTLVRRYLGSSVEISVPDQGLVAHIDSATGSGVLQPGQHLLTGSLTAKDSWRREIDVSLAPAGLEALGLVLHANASSGRLPVLGGSGSRHGVGEFHRWRRGGAWELGLSFGLLGGRLHYDGGISRSEQTVVTVSRLDSLQSLLAQRTPWRRGGSQWHRLDADLLKGDRASASVYAMYGKMDDTYRSLLRRSASPLNSDGTTRELGANFTLAGSTFSIAHLSNLGPDFKTVSTEGRLKLGRLNLSVVKNDDTIQSVSDQASWQSRQKALTVTGRLAFDDLWHDGRFHSIAPDYARVKYFQAQSLSGESEGQARTERRKLAVEFGKSIGSSTATLGVSRLETRDISPSLGTNFMSGETTLDFSHSLLGKDWDIFIYGSLNLASSGTRIKRFQYGGMSLSFSGAHRPKLSFSIDADSYKMRDQVSAFDFAARGLNFSAAADFSYLVPGTKAGGNYLILKAFNDWSSTKTTGRAGPGRAKLVPTVLVMGGARF